MNIEFYVFQNATQQETWVAACHLIEKWVTDNQTITVLLSSPKEAQMLDQLLWTFSDQSFIPHKLSDHDATLIHIPSDQQPDVMINLSNQAITDYQAKKRLVEIVFSDVTMQQLARDRYRLYREKGHNLKTHKMSANDVNRKNVST